MLPLVLILALTAPTQARPQEWRLVAASDQAMMAIDTGNVVSSGATRRFWTMIVYDEPDDGFVRSMGLQQIDCEERRVRTLQGSFFRADGTVRHSPESGQWGYVVPGTFDEANAKAVCDYAVHQGEPYETVHAFAAFAADYYASR